MFQYYYEVNLTFIKQKSTGNVTVCCRLVVEYVRTIVIVTFFCNHAKHYGIICQIMVYFIILEEIKFASNFYYYYKKVEDTKDVL